MYTNCPECGTVFRISTSELRVAEGHVRCGHCAATFNALATLADELPPTVTVEQLTLPAESGPEPTGEPEATTPEPEAPPMAGFPSEPAQALAPPALESVATYVPLPISEETLEFDIPEDRWSNFFEGNAPPPAQTDVGTGIGSETVDQVGLYRALSAEASSPALDDEADWRALLSEVQDDEASPEPVYVISEEAAPVEIQEPALPELAWDDPPESSMQAPEPLPEDFSANLPGAPEAASEPSSDPTPAPELDSEPFTADRPFRWTPPVAPAAVRSGHHWAYSAGSALLALLLVMQLLHRQRDELATNPTLASALQRTYAAMGLPLWPTWDLRAYQLRNSEAVADRSSPGALDILARIAVVGEERVGLPFVRVTLRDGLARPLGSRVFPPEEYLGKNPRPREPVSPGTLIPVEISLKDPGRDAQGFDVDVCVMRRHEGMVCRAEREPFLR